MVAPTVASVTPAIGSTLGETFIKIVGADFNLVALGTVRVFFDNQEAKEVQVISSTEIYCLSPRSVVDTYPFAVDVRVENTTTQILPTPPLVESGSLASAYEYRRPSIATDDDNRNDCVVKINQALVSDFMRYVLENTHIKTHPEYVDLESQAAEEEKQAKDGPSVKILGPEIQEDLFYREGQGGRITVDEGGGDFSIYDHPLVLQLEYAYVCVGRSSGEVGNLLARVLHYFQKTPDLVVAVDGVDPSNGFVTYEQGVIPEQVGDTKTAANRHGVYQTSGSFLLRGVTVLADKIGEGKGVVNTLLQIDPLP